ncbi:MAG: site-2 protease family protein [Myxococcales bacterium]|nr:site-2 protease family protein [Myxococcales bacterium]
MLRWRLFGIPVVIQPYFFLIAVFLGAGTWDGDDWLVEMLCWIGLVLGGVLAHEMGHALAGRFFGRVPTIELHGMGGVTRWVEGGALSAGSNLVVSVAGPLVGMVLGGLSLLLLLVLGPQEGTLLYYVLSSSVWINLGWGVLNLLPMMPLDGGHVMASILEMFVGNRRRATHLAYGVSLGVLVVVTLLIVQYAFAIWNLLLVGLFFMSNLAGFRATAAAK